MKLKAQNFELKLSGIERFIIENIQHLLISKRTIYNLKIVNYFLSLIDNFFN